MQRLRYLIVVLAAVLPLEAETQLRVFACEPEWSALAEEIGGDRVRAHSGTHALQDPHYVEARPSLISKVRKADLVVCSGAQLEIGWLPALLGKANNPDVLPGSNGFLEASSVVPRLGASDGVDRAQGDIHPQGNPHIQMNPHNILRVARAMGERMALIDPENAAVYQQGVEDFANRWEQAIAGWEKRARPLAGARVVCHHQSWVYLEDWLQLQEVATLEPVPGIPPTTNHLSSLLADLGTDGTGADVIIRAPFQSEKASLWLQERTGIPAVMLPLTVGGTEGATDLFRLFDDILDRLLAADGNRR
jgi:zinc/manganese transport system substrate-binding protein